MNWRTQVGTLTIVAALLAACGGAKEVPTSTGAAPAASQPTRAAATAPAAPTTAVVTRPTATSEIAATEESLPLPKKNALQSYTSHMEVREDVIKPAESVASWTTMEIKFSGEPAPGVTEMTVTEKVGNGAPTHMIQTAEAYFMLDGETGKWMKLPAGGAGSPAGALMTLDSLAASDDDQDFLKKYRVVSRREAVEGVSTTHYRATDNQPGALGEPDNMLQEGETLVSAQSDLWVANRGSYVKKFEMVSVVDTAEGQQLKRSYSWLVNDENSKVEITIPTEDEIISIPGLGDVSGGGLPTAQPAPVTGFIADLPIPPGAKEATPDAMPAQLGMMASMMATAKLPIRMLTTTGTAAEVATFYKQELPKKGLTLLAEQPAASGLQSLIFSGGDQSLQLYIVALAGGGSAIMLVGQ